MHNLPIGIQLSQNDREAVMAAIAKIKAKLPFLIDFVEHSCQISCSNDTRGRSITKTD